MSLLCPSVLESEITHALQGLGNSQVAAAMNTISLNLFQLRLHLEWFGGKGLSRERRLEKQPPVGSLLSSANTLGVNVSPSLENNDWH